MFYNINLFIGFLSSRLMKKNYNNALKKFLVGTSLASSLLFSGCNVDFVPFEFNRNMKKVDYQPFVGLNSKGVSYDQKFSQEELSFEEIPSYAEQTPVTLENISDKFFTHGVEIGNSFVLRDFPVRFNVEGEFDYVVKNRVMKFSHDVRESTEGNWKRSIDYFAGSRPVYTFAPSVGVEFNIPTYYTNPAPAGPKKNHYGIAIEADVGLPITKFEWQKYFTENSIGKTTYLAKENVFGTGSRLSLGVSIDSYYYKGRERNESRTKLGIKCSRESYPSIKLGDGKNKAALYWFLFDVEINL